MNFASYLAGIRGPKGESIFDHRPHGVKDLDKKEKLSPTPVPKDKKDDHEKK